MSYIAAGGTVVGFPYIGNTAGGAAPSWVPVASGVNANLFTDFTTEGGTNHYWFNNTAYGSFALWLAAIGGTFTRAATTNGAWYTTNSSGLLASAGTNVLRFNYNPTGPSAIGILLETAATNLALWSRDLTQSGTWVATTMTTALTSTGADGAANSATRLTAAAPLATILQTPGLASAARTYSVYIRRVTGTGTIKLTVDGTTFSSDLSGSLNSSTYTRVTDTQTVIPIIGIQIGTSGDAIDVDFNQLETGVVANGAPTSPILTTTVTVTRPVDTLTWPVPFTAWSTTVGSVIANSVSIVGAANLSSLSFSDGTNNNRIQNQVGGTGTTGVLTVTDGGVAQAATAATGGSNTAYALNKTGTAWTANDFVSIINGGTAATDNSGTIPVGLNIARVGMTGGGTVNVAGCVASLAYWGSRISNADLATLTT